MVKDIKLEDIHICEGENNTICQLLKKSKELSIDVTHNAEKKESANVCNAPCAKKI